MGGGYYDPKDYAQRVTARVAASPTGSSMGYHDDVASKTSRSSWKVHPDMDIKGRVRESVTGPDHPNPTPVAVFLDVTGSMADHPRVIQKKLPNLLGVLSRKAYIEDPQVLIGAVGDHDGDMVPFQVGQFESDARVEDALNNMFLEGGGGGNGKESYDAVLYWAARKVKLDAATKGKLGYLFIIADDNIVTTVSPRMILDVFGDVVEPIQTQTLVDESKALWDVRILVPTGHGIDKMRAWYGQYFGEYIYEVDSELVCEKIAAIIGMDSGLSRDSVDRDLAEVGVKTSLTKDLVLRSSTGIDVTVPKTKKTNQVTKF
jgi:hypothetical protein